MGYLKIVIPDSYRGWVSSRAVAERARRQVKLMLPMDIGMILNSVAGFVRRAGIAAE